MTVSWTPEQVLNLAPDNASRKNAAGLSSPRKWKLLCRRKNDSIHVLWGEYQGSGADPYRCQVDVNGPAFKCSCPSKKVPCKHALGLFLLFAGQPNAFETGDLPDWVSAWLAKRAEINTRRAARADEPPPPPDAKAQARRAAERDRKIRAGLDELDTWLRDLLRQGLATAQNQPRTFWDNAAARLVDAQAPGLARILREELAGAASTGDGWQDRLLDGVARLYLALEGYRRIETLPPQTQADLRAVIGFNLKQEELLNEPGLADTWLVLGREIEEETQLKVQRTWLWGAATGRPALVLNFAPAAGGVLDTSLVPGTAFPGELVFYPGAFPLRALIRARQPVCEFPARLPGCASLVGALAGYAAALSANPWLERYPLLLNDVIPGEENGEWAIYDGEGRCMPLAKRFQHGWTLLAMSGGTSLELFGIWNGERLLPLSARCPGDGGSGLVYFRPIELPF